MIYRREEYIEESDENAKFPVKHIEVLVPIDNSKKIFVGQVTLGLQTPLGVQQVPVTFEIEAAEVAEAFAKFERYAEPKIEEARRSIEEELQRMRSEASRRIVRPDELGLGGGLAGLGGGQAGGGKIMPFKPK